MSERGFYLVSRGMFEHARFKPRGPFSDMEAMLWLVESAAHTPMDVSVDCGSNRKVVHLERGQLTYSIRYLARAWRWSDKRVQRFFSALTLDQTLTTQTTTGQTLITLCNYEKHQRSSEATTTAATTATTTAATTNKKQLKQLEKDIASPKGSAEPEGFQNWYSVYPKKKQPLAAKRAFAKAIGSGAITLDALMTKTKAFAVATNWATLSKQERKFIPYPASWLNAGGYYDEPEGDGGEPAPVVDPHAFTEGQWRKRLDHVKAGGDWMEAWGAKPGAPGCLVPPHLIVTPVSTSKGAA
jgi:hypothetical protein